MEAYVALPNPLTKAQFIPDISTQINLYRIMESIRETYQHSPESADGIKNAL